MENQESTAQSLEQGQKDAVATPNINQEAAKTPETSSVDLHGFTQEDLAGMRTFIDNNGGWDKIKSRISNPQSQPVEKPVENLQQDPQKQEEPTSHTQAQPVQSQKPQGRTNDDLMAEYYFEKLSQKPEYASIAKEIVNGDVITEMDKLGIQYKYSDGSWNNDRINEYLKLRAQTVPARPTETEPNASAAPTVSYTEVGDSITDINQAYKVLLEPGNPGMAKAEEFIKNYLNPNAGKK